MRTLLYIIEKRSLLIAVLVLITSTILGGSLKKPSDDRKTQFGYIPKSGFVPNEVTAIKIAEAIWFPIYGDRIFRKKPYIVKLKNNIWIVEGTLSPKSKGGVPYIEIQKKDGKVLKVFFDK